MLWKVPRPAVGLATVSIVSPGGESNADSRERATVGALFVMPSHTSPTKGVAPHTGPWEADTTAVQHHNRFRYLALGTRPRPFVSRWLLPRLVGVLEAHAGGGSSL